MSHLVKVDDCEAICLSGPHVLYTEEEPLGVLVSVEIKTKVEFIVPSTTGERREKGGGMEREEGRVSFNTVWMVTLTLTHHTPLHLHLHSLCKVATLKPRLKHQGCTFRGKGGRSLGGCAGTSSGTSKLHKRCKPSITHLIKRILIGSHKAEAWVAARICLVTLDNSQANSLGTIVRVGLTYFSCPGWLV